MNTKASFAPSRHRRAAYFLRGSLRSLRDRDVRRVGRSGAPQTFACALRSVVPRLSGATISSVGFRAHGNERRRFLQKSRRIPSQRQRRRRRRIKKSEFLNNACDIFRGITTIPRRSVSWRSDLEELDSEGQLDGNRLFYLATPPEVYLHVIEQLKKADLKQTQDPKNPGRASSSKNRSGTIWRRRKI